MSILDDVNRIIILARTAEKLDYHRDIDKFKRYLLLIRQIDLWELVEIKKKEYPPELAPNCQKILKKANILLRRIESKEVQFEELQDFLKFVISLEQLALKKSEEIESGAPVKLSLNQLMKLLKSNPNVAREKGFLFRGVSEEDHQKIKKGEILFAADPFGQATIVEHILDPTNNPHTPFISLTENPRTAERFGKIIAISKKELQGHLFTPEEIDSILRHSSPLWSRAKRLQQKNYEFILGPAKGIPAAIPHKAVIL